MKLLSIILSFVAAASALAPAQTAPALSAADQKRQRVLKFYLSRTVDDYQRVGTRSPSWDADAQGALAALARVLAWDFRPDGDEYDTILEASRRLNDAGCSDPLVLYARARAAVHFNRRYEDLLPLHMEAAKRISASAYDPVIKCTVNLRAAWLRARDRSDTRTSRREGRRMVESAMSALPKALADPEVPTEVVLNLFDLIGDASQVVERDRAVIFERAVPILEKSPRNAPALVLTARAEFYLNYAMDARRDTTSPREQADKLAGDRLNQAAAAAEQAWQADASCARTADLMMQIEFARGAAPSLVEQWFTRALEADPNRLATCTNRLRTLEPRPGSSVQPMIAFARRCSQNPDPDCGIPLLLVEAHLRAACFTDAGEQDEPRREYFTSSPEVWNDIRAVYEPHIQRHPDSLYHRSRYAQLAAWCGQWGESDKQLRAMGEQFSMSWLRGKETWVALRAEVAQHIGR